MAAVQLEDPRSFLFGCFVRVTFEPAKSNDAAGKLEWEPRVVDQVPYEIDEELVSVFPLIPQFCFPDLEKPEPITGGENPIVDIEPCFFMFVLTDAHAEHIYVSCVVRYTTVTPSSATQRFKVPVALCFLGRNPYFELGYKTLAALCHLTSCPEDRPKANSRLSVALASVSPSSLRSGTASTAVVPPPPGSGKAPKEDMLTPLLIKQFLKDLITRSRAPPVGQRLAVDLFGHRLDWQRIDHCPGMPHKDDDMLLVLIARLPVEAIVQVVEALLMEQKVVLHSHYRNELVPCCEALFSLMSPFWWQHTYVPCLPALLIEYLEAPFPYLMGIRTGGILEAPLEQREVLDDVVLVDLNRGVVTLPDYVSGGDLLRIPEPLRSKLVADVEHIVEQNAPREPTRFFSLSRARSRSTNSAYREAKSAFAMPTWRELRTSNGTVQDLLETGGPNKSYAIWIDQIQAAFFRIWVSKEDSGMFQSYKSFLRLEAPSPAPLTLERGARTHLFEALFDKGGFLKASPEAYRPFLQAFFKTQLFVTLIHDSFNFNHSQGATTGNSQDLQLVDLCIAAQSNDVIDTVLCRRPIKTWQTHDAGMPSDALPLEGVHLTCFPSLQKSGSPDVPCSVGANSTTRAESSDSEPASPRPFLSPKRSMNSFSIQQALNRTRNSQAHSSHNLMNDSIQISGNAERLSRLLQPDLEGLEKLDRAVSAAENGGAAEESSSAGAGASARRRAYKKNILSL